MMQGESLTAKITFSKAHGEHQTITHVNMAFDHNFDADFTLFPSDKTEDHEMALQLVAQVFAQAFQKLPSRTPRTLWRW